MHTRRAKWSGSASLEAALSEPYEIEFFRQPPEEESALAGPGDRSRLTATGGGYYFRLDGDERWNGPWDSEVSAERELRIDLNLGVRKMTKDLEKAHSRVNAARRELGAATRNLLLLQDRSGVLEDARRVLREKDAAQAEPAPTMTL